MRYKLFYILGLVLLCSSCVSKKSYTAMESRLLEKERENKSVQSDYTALFTQHGIIKDSLLMIKYENSVERQKFEVLTKELHKNDQITSGLKLELVDKEKAIEDLTNKNDILIDTNKRYSEITKSLIENLENQNLKVLNLSLALQKQDSVNVNRVKKTKSEITEQKYKKALEKLGFVFN